MDPKIIFEDEFLMVLDKPAGMVVNKAETTAGVETVQDWVEKMKILNPKSAFRKKTCSKQAILNGNGLEFRNSNLEFTRRAGIVHRLDKETSGLLLVAKTPAAFENLQAQFKERKVKKKYLALVHGKLEPESGEIKAPVGRLPWNRERFGVFPGGREAITKYGVKNNYTLDAKPYTLIELTPHTGRTHQIRVHLKYLGHPIVSDEFYAGRKTAREDRLWCPRVFLHAFSIGFYHPKSGEWQEFEAELPEDLKKPLEKLTG